MATIAVESINGKTCYVIIVSGERCFIERTMTEAIINCISVGVVPEVVYG